MAVSTRLPQPWDDPNAYAPGDPNAPIYSNTPTPVKPPTTVAPGTPYYDAPSDTAAPTPKQEAVNNSGTGGLPTIDNGAGGTTTVPPPPTGWEPWTGTTPIERDPVDSPYNAPAPSGGGGTTPPPDSSPSGSGGGGSAPAPWDGYRPPMSDRANSYQGRGDAGLNDVWNQAPIMPGNDDRLKRFQGLSEEAINRIMNGPDRYQLAKDYYNIFDQETQGDYQRDLKEATNLGAARGRLGSGLLTNSYGDLFERRAQDKDSAKRRLLTDALEGTIGDRQNAYRSVADAENMAYGQGVGDRDEARIERNARLAQIDRFFAERDNEINRDIGFRNEAREDQQYADDLGYRGRQEERTDRSYESEQAQQAILNRIRQRELELQQQQQEWDRAYQLWQMGQGPRPEGSRPTTSTAGV
jgi:hypothetical protein